MLHLPRLALLTLLAVGIAPACGGDDEADAVQDYLAGIDASARNICECDYNNPLYLLAFGKIAYGSSDECLMDLPPNAAERGCTAGLFQDQTVDYSAVLSCRAAALSRSDTCLASKTCTDTARVDCYMTLNDEVKACADLPDDVENKLTDCLYN
jgi:hypothetical protein